MPRGRSKRGRRLGGISIFSTKKIGYESTSDKFESKPKKNENNTLDADSISGKTEENDVFIENDQQVGGYKPPPKRLTEGEIDVDDAESEISEAEEDLSVQCEKRSYTAPSDQAAEACRLSPKKVSTEEFALFPFLETASSMLREAYLIVRNSACLMWVEDPTTQVTSDRLVGFLVTSLSQDFIRVMYEAGITASLPSPGKASTEIGSSMTLANAERCDIKNIPKILTFTPPSSWLPWSTPNARLNLERLAYLVVLFLERFGYINYGVFKILSPSLTRALVSKSIVKTSSSTFLNGPDKPTSMRKSAAVLGAGTTSTGRRNVSPSSERGSSIAPAVPIKIIICGAGTAGLIAARQLTYFGAKVTVLEARDRIGGRVWTYKKGDTIFDLGAMIVTGMSANPVTILAKQTAHLLQPVNTGCILYAPSGRPVSREKDERMEEEFNRLLGTATHLCHNKGLEVDASTGSLLSLGGILEDLIRYQENHIIPLKKTHRKLVSVLLERKEKVLNQMSTARKVIEKAHEEWQAAAQLSREASERNSRDDFKPSEEIPSTSKVEGEPSVTQTTSYSPPKLGEKRNASVEETKCESLAKQQAVGRRIPHRIVESVNAPASKSLSTPGATIPESLSIKKENPPKIIHAELEYEARRLLSELHQAWKDFDPLQSSLAKINRQLELLEQNPPKETYLTPLERNLIDWHFANLEFANATELKNLSLRHWDQDDAFEMVGPHCVIRGGFGSLVDALVASTASVTSLPNYPSPFTAGSIEERPALKADVTSMSSPTSGGCGQVELKSSVKCIKVFEKGVIVESLNAAFSQDEVISYEGAAVLCTFPLGVLKESVRQQKEFPKKQSTNVLRATAPIFNPPLPEWKISAIQRLGFGVLNKVVLLFDRFFWDKNQRSFGYVHDSTEKRGELFLFWSVTDKPCLVALVAGKAAIDLEMERDLSTSNKTSRISSSSSSSNTGVYLKEPIVLRAMTLLRKIFRRDSACQIVGNESAKFVPDPIDAFVTRWESDVFCRGSYSYVAVGASGADYDVLAEPYGLTDHDPLPVSASTLDNGNRSTIVYPQTLPSNLLPRVYFAGEHTCRRYPASVHGAFLSGLREAARLANALFPGEIPVVKSGFFLNSRVDPSQ